MDKAKLAVLTPVNETGAVELSRKVFRKQVLKAGAFSYNGRELDFSPEYLDRIVEAYKRQAYDSVPFMLADEKNAHTMDPERYRGDVIGLERTPDGLDALISLTDEAAKIAADAPNFGVSVRLLEDLERGDGEKFPVALQHVLGTFDPRMTGMRPWEAVEMSNEGVSNVLDLTELTSAPSAEKKGTTVAETQGLSEDTLRKLAAFAANLNDDGTVTTTDDVDDNDEPTDEELEEIARTYLASREGKGAEQPSTPEAAPQVVAASNSTSEPTAAEIEMATRLDRMEKRNAQLESEAAERRYTELQRRLTQDSGIPPAVVDMCKPWLMTSNSIELSSGETRDPGPDIVRMLEELGKGLAVMDFSEPTVFPDAVREQAEEASNTANAQWAKQFMAQQGLT